MTRIRPLGLCFIFFLSAGLMNHVLVIPLLAETGGRDAWLSILLVMPPGLLGLALLYYLIQRLSGSSLPQWTKARYGRAASLLLTVPLLLQLLLILFMTVKDTTNWTEATYLPRTPDLVVALLFMGLCFAAAQFGIGSIAIMAYLLLPFVVILGHFVMGANIRYKDYSFLRPFLEHGMGPVWHGMLYASGGLAEMAVLLLVNHRLSKPFKLWGLLLAGTLVTSLSIGPLIGGYAEFGPAEMMKQRYPSYAQWRLVSVGKYIEHLDFFAIYQWLSGAFVRVSFAMFVIADVTGLKGRKRSFVLLLLSLLLVLAVLLPISDHRFLTMVKEIFIPYTVGSAILVLLAAAGLVFLASRRKKANANE
ncbi:endospore germination permease [Paenibacillus aurantius]|uniref:Endospore germination permease n=1 Tax=Paenibacillus aurantius TaxID=2918900 RepID=A0AA96LEU1_9BACL|nr:endospore germination permease [Paenibacillus aurantius]WNQ11903.1 endospore germination permease [Paenibacillus aurantius]